MNELFHLEMNGIPKEDIYLLPRDAIMQREEKDKVGYLIGQDWAYYKQPLPDNADAAIYRGYESNTAHIPGRIEVDRFTKKWLQLRYHAYLRNRTVSESIDTKLLQAIDISFCRITKKNLTHSTKGPDDWSVERLCNVAGYALGNITIISKEANEARGSMNFEEICAASTSSRATNGLKAHEWMRYKDLVRGPYFWAGHVKGIEPLSTPVAKLVFCAPSQLLQDISFWAIAHKHRERRELSKKILNIISPKSSSKKKLKKLFTRIDRHFEKGHLLFQTFSNKSCMEEFKDWYEATDLTVKSYLDFFSGARNGHLHLPKNTQLDENPIEEWWLNTGGYFY
jgi:hypothetical protein